ncbi:MAG TPA: DUF4861 family protein [Pyrinomonadaceae bacterium]|nr:DUF4861 family protein [Pyrinomonadaceae bacterium]
MKIGLLIAFLLAVPLSTSAQTELTVTAVNKLNLARQRETIELTARDLASLAEKDLTKLHVRDSSGKEVLAQSVDTDYDDYRKPDILIFQSDFKPDETKRFIVFAGPKREYKKEDFRAYGRFVRERFDDFAWENDRIAHRTYGNALAFWKGEPLTSSAIDIWSKRTPKMVINDWYMVDNYHTDTGEGVDAYSAGPTRGCGGSGIWANGHLFTPRNFVQSRVLANGPIRVMFELVYPHFQGPDVSVLHVLRVSLDGGSQLNHFEAFYRSEPGDRPLTIAVGLKKVEEAQKEFNAEHGRLTTWEPMAKDLGMQGLAIVANPREVDTVTEDNLNHLLVLKPTKNTMPISYWAGFAWDRAGMITSKRMWDKYVDEFSQMRQSPIEVKVK